MILYTVYSLWRVHTLQKKQQHLSKKKNILIFYIDGFLHPFFYKENRL